MPYTVGFSMDVAHSFNFDHIILTYKHNLSSLGMQHGAVGSMWNAIYIFTLPASLKAIIHMEVGPAPPPPEKPSLP